MNPTIMKNLKVKATGLSGIDRKSYYVFP